MLVRSPKRYIKRFLSLDLAFVNFCYFYIYRGNDLCIQNVFETNKQTNYLLVQIIQHILPFVYEGPLPFTLDNYHIFILFYQNEELAAKIILNHFIASCIFMIISII